MGFEQNDLKFKWSRENPKQADAKSRSMFKGDNDQYLNQFELSKEFIY